jgi:tRNA(Ile)-lysidine synthase
VIIARVRRTLRERGLLEAGGRVVCACSGGPDSAGLLVALAQLQAELDFTLEAASVDHGLRAEAALDVEIAREQARAVGVPFHALRVQVTQQGSLQAAARTARYAALRALAAQLSASRLALGHTRDDQAETVLMRVLRGAGVLGLAGIDPARADGVIRPLIDCDRSAVAEFAARHCDRLARDPSNGDTRFERVRVRAELLPALAREDPAIVEHLCDLAEDAHALRALLAPQARDALAHCLQEPAIIDVSCLNRNPTALRRLVLRAWLEPQLGAELGRAHIEQLERAALLGGEIWLPNGFRVHVQRAGALTLVPPAPGSQASGKIAADAGALTSSDRASAESRKP